MKTNIPTLLHRFNISLFLVVCCVFLQSQQFAWSAPLPNIVVIYTDDQGYGDVSALNPDAKFQTPNMDRLAKEGLTFTDGHCSDTVCTPSRYGLLTGRYSWRTARLKKGVMGADADCLIADGRMTVPSLLKQHGYKTAMIGKWHLGMQIPGNKGKRDWSAPVKDGPITKGFDYYFGIPASMNYGVLTYIENDKILEPATKWTRKKHPKSEIDSGAAAYRMMPPYDDEPKGKGDIEVAPSFIDELVLETFTNRAVKYISESAQDAKSGKPFFLYFPVNSPHLPHSTHPDFIGKSKMGEYGDFMEETDHRVGQILKALDDNRLTENTLVFFSSDNGAETNYRDWKRIYNHQCNGDFRGGKRDIYEGGHRVPFLMRWPGVIEPNSKSNVPVCQTDLLATVAQIVGAKLPNNAGEDSFGLLSIMRNSSEVIPAHGPVIHHSGSGHFAIRDGKWKLNMFRGSGGSLAPKMVKPKKGQSPYELYNLETDPGETNDVSAENPGIVKQLTESITKIVQSGRSRDGKPTSNDGPKHWPQLTWIEK
ncbi:MAG: arylsulfatase [Blastopirellula sp.]|nr:MAG: arylsulfatase [Blastopirellula sp.]